MKNKIVSIVCVFAFLCVSCDSDEQFKGELYKKVIYVLSGDDLTYSANHDLNEEESMGFVSVVCGGTESLDKDVKVVLEPDTTLLSTYNRLNFDIDSSKFAKALSSERYRIPDMNTTLKANSEECYSVIPIYVKPEGLSPDSTYLIPLRIKSVSDYEVNPEKQSVLYHVLLKNNYATQSPTVYYKTRGTDVEFQGNGTDVASSSPYTLSRVVVPLTKNSIRCFVGMNTYTTANVTVADIQKYAIQIVVNEDASLSILPIGTLQVERMEDAASNCYSSKVSALTSKHIFELHYRYRLLKEGRDGSNGDDDYEVWHEIAESMEVVLDN